MTTAQHNLTKQASVGKTAYARISTAAIMIGLGLLIFVTYLRGLDNLPVAEDFIRPQEFMILGDDRQFRPVFAILMLAIQSIAGPQQASAMAYHAFSLVVHCIATIGLFLLVLRLTSQPWMAATTALLFALYPRHHEPIFWPAASLHALMTACVLYSLICYLKGRETGSRSWLICSVMLYAAGLLTSEDGATGIVGFIAYELLWENRRVGRTIRQKLLALIWRLVPFTLVVGLYATVLLAGSTNPARFIGRHNDSSFYHLSLSVYQVKDFGGYLSYALFPFVPLRAGIATFAKLGMLAATCVAAAICIIWGTRLVRFGAIWSIVTVLPYVLLVPFGNADRYFYLPAVGVCIAAAGLFQVLPESAAVRFGQQGQRLAVSAVMVLLLVYTGLGFQAIQRRSEEWDAAGKMAARILGQVMAAHQTVDRNTTFYFLNLPSQYLQAKVLGFGTRAALRAHYNQPDLTVNAGESSELLPAITHAPPSRFTGDQTYIYVYADGKLLDYSSSFRDPGVRLLMSRQIWHP